MALELKQSTVTLEFESGNRVTMTRLEAEVLLLGLAELLDFVVWKVREMDDGPSRAAEEQCD